MAIPSTNIFNSLNLSKLSVVNVNIVSNSHKWLMNIGNRIFQYSLFFKVSFIGLSNLLIQLMNVRIKENNSHSLKRY